MISMKILIVEDDVIVALDIKNILISLGHSVTSMVTSYTDAMNSIQTNKPELIFSDINLGKKSKDGIELMQTIQQKSKELPFFFA